MELTEPIPSINNQLVDLFGIDTASGEAIWRVVFSEDQLEKRFGTYDDISPNGIFIRSVTEWREVPKYRQWIHEKFVLERLTIVPEVNKDTLSDKLSYEPIYVFETKNGDYLPPKIEAAKFIIDTLYAASGKKSMAKYVEDAEENSHQGEPYEQRIKKLQEYLFGNETDTTDALAHGSGVVVPTNFEGNK